MRFIRLLQVGTLFGVLLLWWVVTTFAKIDPVILPGPGAVLRQLVDSNICRPAGKGSARMQCGVQGYFLWQHLLATVQRIAVGLGAGVILGVLLGWLLSMNSVVRAVVDPYLGFLRALPPLGYIGLLIVWFGIGDVSKVVLLFLATFPAVTVGTMTGFARVKADWVRAAETWGATRAQIFRRVQVPGALPEILTGIRIASGLAWSAIVAAEMNNGIPGIGGLAYISGTQLNTALTIGSIIVIGLTALAFDLFIQIFQRKASV
ncbi:ABC transporter permease [Corynebacterium suicordis]|uniref:ABC transporter permease n=1 Tax=Corynebacterium suicordis DSM 45110 TaxID=1121369 RepID=A0ABR9ZGX8_9CORY|nr:ABC transporter permease [Corynebacterium suicordis]MBF4552670.1 ABC transporter permease [Corynebacterium suicordis DSM 45110]MDR6278371.1 taurine transport system permease protein [Corynebacterium suicordis]